MKGSDRFCSAETHCHSYSFISFFQLSSSQFVFQGRFEGNTSFFIFPFLESFSLLSFFSLFPQTSFCTFQTRSNSHISYEVLYLQSNVYWSGLFQSFSETFPTIIPFSFFPIIRNYLGRSVYSRNCFFLLLCFTWPSLRTQKLRDFDENFESILFLCLFEIACGLRSLSGFEKNSDPQFSISSSSNAIFIFVLHRPMRVIFCGLLLLFSLILFFTPLPLRFFGSSLQNSSFPSPTHGESSLSFLPLKTNFSGRSSHFIDVNVLIYPFTFVISSLTRPLITFSMSLSVFILCWSYFFSFPRFWSCSCIIRSSSCLSYDDSTYKVASSFVDVQHSSFSLPPQNRPVASIFETILFLSFITSCQSINLYHLDSGYEWEMKM